MKSAFNIYLVLCLFAFGCSKNPDPQPPTPQVPATTKAILLSPANNEVCYSGVVLSRDTSQVSFKWSASPSVESYSIVITNLSSGKSSTLAGLKSAEAVVKLDRNIPYSWLVKTKSNINGEILESDTWKFYNSGEGISSYAPYPAQLLSPAMNQNAISLAGKLNLSWAGSDPDKDISGYDVYFGTSATPPLLKAKQESSPYSVSVTVGTTYYWKIITKDSKGNESESETYNFTAR